MLTPARLFLREYHPLTGSNPKMAGTVYPLAIRVEELLWPHQAANRKQW